LAVHPVKILLGYAGISKMTVLVPFHSPSRAPMPSQSQVTASPRTEEHFQRFSDVLKAAGAREALSYLQSLSDYRFIGIFRFQNGKANAAIHIDRENTDVLAATEVPDTATYCCYVRDSRGVFTTANALTDQRLTDHPAREAVLAYCGVPVMDPSGNLLGTLCHYDVVPRDPAQLDFELLLRVAVALEQGDHVPPYPVAAG
jgi:GAF domain-containing protein